MPNAVIDLRKLKEELKRRITPENELPAASLPAVSQSNRSNLPAPEEELLLQTEKAAHPEGFPDEAEQPAGLIAWTAPDADPESAAVPQLLFGGVLILGGVVAAFLKNPLFAILLGISGGLLIAHAFRTPRQLRLAVTARGIQVGGRLYEFDATESFWIFYDPPLFKELSLRSKKTMMPVIRVPLGDLDPLRLRGILLRFLREQEQELSLTDILSKRLGF